MNNENIDNLKVVFICDNIGKEDNKLLFTRKLLENSYGFFSLNTNRYEEWKKQGVLIIESSSKVDPIKYSEELREYIKLLNNRKAELIYVLMGWDSHKYNVDIDKSTNTVILCMDPYNEREYVDKKVLKRINTLLLNSNNKEINWYGK
jgi:uracil DNA glycosylase